MNWLTKFSTKAMPS